MPRLLVTRPRDDAEALARRLDKLGVEALIEPLLTIEFRSGVNVRLEGAQAVLATSANGVRALAALTTRRDVPVFAVGPTSARTARDLGFKAVESANGAVDDLAWLATTRLDPKHGAVVHVAGSDVAGDLAGHLEARGFEYRRAVLYEARPVTALSDAARQALAEGSLASAIFFSPRTARTFVSVIQSHGLEPACAGMVAFCLSTAIAEVAGTIRWRLAHVTKRPDEDSAIAAVEAWLG
ncbi:MAG: uroporphyrinogen-III synthase [Rhodospirillales bacterium]|nr:uroporphyrinogen-III synthase [Rhodospirillales bacterium]